MGNVVEYSVSNTIGKVECCAIAVNGEYCVTGSYDGTLIVWNVLDGQIRHKLKGHTYPVIRSSILIYY